MTAEISTGDKNFVQHMRGRKGRAVLRGPVVPLQLQDFTHGPCADMEEHQKIMPDQAAVLLALNLVAIENPGLFPDGALDYISRRCVALMQDDALKRDALLGAVADVLAPYGARLKGLRLALVGMHEEAHIRLDFWPADAFLFPIPDMGVRAAGAQKLLGLFGAVTRFDEAYPLCAEAAEDPAHKGRYDVVLSGNVINDPAHKKTALETFLSCAALARVDGAVAHVTSYSAHHFGRHVANEAVAATSGQQLEANPLLGQEGGETAFFLYRQQRPLSAPVSTLVARHQKPGLATRLYRALRGEGERPSSFPDRSGPDDRAEL